MEMLPLEGFLNNLFARSIIDKRCGKSMDDERGSETLMDGKAELNVDLELLFAPDSVDDESAEAVDDHNKDIVLDSDDDRTEFGGSDRLNCVRNERNAELNNSCLRIRKQPRAGCLWRNSQKVSRQSAFPPITGTCKLQFRSTDNKIAQVANEEHNRQKQSEGLSNHMEAIVMKNAAKELLTRDDSDGRRLSSNNSEMTDGGNDVPIVTSVHEPVSLPYIDSQDPEEVSISESLSFVDHYLSLNELNLCDSERESPKKSTHIINLPILNKKGLQSLARKANIKRAEEYGIFDWDERQEKEKNFSLKEGSQLSHEIYKSEVPINQDTDGSNCPEGIDICSTGHEVSVVRQCLNGDSGKVLLASELNPNANCAKELVGDVNISSELHLGEHEDESDGEDFSTGVGFNTQLAAEAMEALLHAPPDSNACYTHKIPSGIIDQSSDVAAMFKKTGNGTSIATGQHIKSKRSAKTLYENEGCPSAEFDQYLRGNSSRLAPNNKLKENGLSVNTNHDDEKIQVRRKSCRNKAQQIKRSPGNIQGRTSPKYLTPNYRDGNFGGNTQSFSVIPKRRRSQSQPLRCSLEHFPCPVEQPKDASDHGMEFGFSKKRSKTNDPITDVQEKCRSKENCSKLASDASLGDDDSSRVVKFKIWSYPKKRRTPLSFMRHSDEPKHQNPMKIFNERPESSPPENHKSTQRFTDNIIVYTRRTKSESASKGSWTIAKHDTSGKSSYFHTSEFPQETGHSVPASHGKEDHIEQTITFDNIINTVHNSESVKFDRGCAIAASELNICNKCDERKINKKEKYVSPVSRELRRLGINKSQPDFKPKDSRRWISSASVSVLFSQNLSDKTIRQLKKILARLGFSEVSCCSAATHFIADKFARTKNMLEAIAFGKLVVTPSWLESCGQAGYSIAEKSYILRDARKEKEIGFSMPVSLARASQRPLLLGQRVLITPNVKPNKDFIQTLVKAVHGQEVEDFQLAETKYDTVSPNLLILSCEEDYGRCEPFLERGIAIYSSELLLNGIIIQKLQYERHRIMMNYIKPKHATMTSGKIKVV